jgi:hypothetical protein
MEHNPKSFIPEHCPNPKCKHHNGFKDKSAWKRAGYFWKHNRKIPYPEVHMPALREILQFPDLLH